MSTSASDDTDGRRSNRLPLSEYHLRLGAALRQTREAAGKTVYEVPRSRGGYYRSGSISNVEGGFSQPSVDMIKDFARLGGKYADLLAMLDAAKKASQQQEPQADDDFDRLLLDPRTDPYLLRRGYVVDTEEGTAHVGADRVLKRTVYRAAVRPTSPNARFFVFRYGYPEDPRRGVASIQAGSGCHLEYVDEQDDGIILAVLRFDNTKLDGYGRCQVSWVIPVESHMPKQPMEDAYTHSRMVQVIKRVQFEEPAVPARIWWFRGHDPFQPKLQPSPEQLLEINPAHVYFHEFYDVEDEVCGLAWHWQE